MAISLSSSYDQNQLALTVTADTGVDEIVTLHVYLNDFDVPITQNLLISPGFVNNVLTINEAALEAIFDKSMLKDGVYVIVAQGATASNQSMTIEIVHKEIDCCLAQHLDGEESEGPIFDKRLKKATRVYLLLQGALIAAERKNLTEAVDKFEEVQRLCTGCGCQGLITKIANKSFLT